MKELTVKTHQLKNGLQLLVQPMQNFPRVDLQIWYNVGSKHEAAHEKGMAHFIEHMLFKGTELLSETDINCITHKLSGYTNAFTSQDYTGYVFRLPSNTWQYAVMLMADCMKNARFDPEMMASEVKAVIEELRLFRDDYQTVALETLSAALFGMHPYHYPIIGSTAHLAGLTQKDLLNFYHRWYTPDNATLVAVGDINPQEFFDCAERFFGSIPAGQKKQQLSVSVPRDLAQQKHYLYRDIQQPWSCFVYLTPAIADPDYILTELVVALLAGDKSARLYKRLVLLEQLASDVDAFAYDFFEQGMLCVTVQAYRVEDKEKIQTLIQEEINKLARHLLEPELQAVKKNALLDFAFLIEQSEKRASFIATHFLATGNAQKLSYYQQEIEGVTVHQIKGSIKKWLRPTMQHQVHLLPINEDDRDFLAMLQEKQEKEEASVLSLFQRKSSVEAGRFVDQVIIPEQSDRFVFPQPEEYFFDSGLELISDASHDVPYVYVILRFAADPYADVSQKQGVYTLLLQVLIHETADYTAQEFHMLLQKEGIRLFTSFDSIRLYCLPTVLERALTLLRDLILRPRFSDEAIQLLLSQQQSDLASFWDEPAAFVDQYIREELFRGTPLALSPLGTKESLAQITAEDVQDCYKKIIVPEGAQLLIVGDFSAQDLVAAKKLFADWSGKKITKEPFLLPAYAPSKKEYSIMRDQTLLVLYAPCFVEIGTPEHYALQLLDIILMGGSGAASSYRLFDIREQTGIFYTIEGSFTCGYEERPGIALIKTIVTPEYVQLASELLLDHLDKIAKNGVTAEEFLMAKNVLKASTVELFETNSSRAHSFLFLKKYKMMLNLFDKQEGFLNILTQDDVHKLARELCNPNRFSMITIGRRL